MKFISAFVNGEKLYSVGKDMESGKYCMAVLVTWIASYTRYFELTKQEFDLHRSDVGKLDEIAESFLRHKDPKESERFLCSEMASEN